MICSRSFECTIIVSLCLGSEIFHRTFCYEGAYTCSNHTFGCQESSINITNVYYTPDQDCLGMPYTYQYPCCCETHMIDRFYNDPRMAKDLRSMCVNSTTCDIGSYLYRRQGKMTVAFTCEGESSETIPVIETTTYSNTNESTHSESATTQRQEISATQTEAITTRDGIKLYDAARLKTFCYFNETFGCRNFSLSCQSHRFIQVHDVWYKAEMTCYTEHCCCMLHSTSDVLRNISNKDDIKRLCDYNQHCDIAEYLINLTGKVTVNFTCEGESSEIIPIFETTTNSSSNGTTNSKAATTQRQESSATQTEAITTPDVKADIPVEEISIAVPVGLLLIIAVAVGIAIYFKRSRNDDPQPSFIRRLMLAFDSRFRHRRLSTDMTYSNAPAIEMYTLDTEEQTGVYCILGPSENDMYSTLTT